MIARRGWPLVALLVAATAAGCPFRLVGPIDGLFDLGAGVDLGVDNASLCYRQTGNGCDPTSATPWCDVATGACVACLPTLYGSCARGQYCEVDAGAAPACRPCPRDGGSCPDVDLPCGSGPGCGSGPHVACLVGACTCLDGYLDCDGDLANGCEVDGDIDPVNCGSCGTTCAAGQTCRLGNCV